MDAAKQEKNVDLIHKAVLHLQMFRQKKDTQLVRVWNVPQEYFAPMRGLDVAVPLNVERSPTPQVIALVSVNHKPAVS